MLLIMTKLFKKSIHVEALCNLTKKKANVLSECSYPF